MLTKEAMPFGRIAEGSVRRRATPIAVGKVTGRAVLMATRSALTLAVVAGLARA